MRPPRYAGPPLERCIWRASSTKPCSDRVVLMPNRWPITGQPPHTFADARQEVRMGIWQLDPYHTQVEFTAKHLGMMTVRGHFADVTATSDIHPEQPESSSVAVTILAASIRTNHEQRDKDVRESNFLDVENFPTITFTSTGVVAAGHDKYTLTGDLTIKGQTRPVSLDVTKYGEFNDPMMGHRIGYGATTQ